MNSQPQIVSGKIKTRTGEMPFEAFNTQACKENTASTLKGETYPHFPFIDYVRTIVDVGANIGAASLFFWMNYPAAKVYAFEPSPETFTVLSRNFAKISLIKPFEIGLLDRDCELPLFQGQHDPATNSFGKSGMNSEQSVPVRLRNAADVMRENNIEKIDILKIDSEGCELPILRSLSHFLPRIKVIHLVYHDEADRLAIDAMLRDTHLLTKAKVTRVHRGELTYVNRASFPSQTDLESKRIRSDAIIDAAAAVAPVPDPMSVEVRAQLVQSHPQSRTPTRSQFEAAVVIPTLMRPSLKAAVESVFAQDALGTMQLLIGIDKATGDRAILDEILALKPDNWEVTIFDPGYSTSARHGGVHFAGDGGALRTILSYTANSRYVAYLDDDNWWAKDHLSSLLKAIAGVQWAFSKRWFVDAATRQPICVDEWESVGPGQGVYQAKFGGFCDPSTLMIDKSACEIALRWWSIPHANNPRSMAADRNVFRSLSTRFTSNGTGKATSFYIMSPTDLRHPARLEHIAGAMKEKAPE